MKVVTYYRVSTKMQGRSGLGLMAQRLSVDRHLASLNAQVLAEFVEVESGGKADRPELTRALRRCRLSGATLIVAKLDRLSRDVEFIAQLQKSAVRFACADTPGASDLTIGLLAVIAQNERQMISTRTREALTAAKARGVRLGNPRLAEIANTDTANARAAHMAKAAERNAQIASVIAEIEAEAGESLPLQAIADQLNEAGYTTARGKAFSKTTVMRIRKAVRQAVRPSGRA